MRTGLRVACGVSAGLLLLCGGAPAARATYPGADGLIVLSVDHAPPDQASVELAQSVYTTTQDGSSTKTLLYTKNRNKISYAGAEWSPNGRKLAYVKYTKTSGGRDIWLMNADGSSKTRLTSGVGDDVSPTWSPDGSKIAFNYHSGDYSEIHIQSALGGRSTRLTRSGGNYGPRWSPKGDRILFSHYNGSSYESRTIAPTGGTEKVVPVFGDWSPTAKMFVFSDYDSASGDNLLVTANVDGTNRKVVYREADNGIGGYFGNPVWSPGGARLALPESYCYAFEDCDFTVKFFTVDGTAINQVSTGGNVNSISWQPTS